MKSFLRFFEIPRSVNALFVTIASVAKFVKEDNVLLT